MGYLGNGTFIYLFNEYILKDFYLPDSSNILF